ncbi:hypothetical protein EVJ58_g8785, partial [Rhodofomes roseus]
MHKQSGVAVAKCMPIIPPIPNPPANSQLAWSNNIYAARTRIAGLCEHIGDLLRQEEGDHVRLSVCMDTLDSQVIPLIKGVARELREGGAWDWVEIVCAEVGKMKASLQLAIDAGTE